MSETKKLAKTMRVMMNKEVKKRDFSCEKIGKILSKEKKKVYQKNNFYGNDYFRLKITDEEQEKECFLFVYPNLVNKQIFKAVTERTYIDKRYLFFCENKPGRLILNNWRELEINHE